MIKHDCEQGGEEWKQLRSGMLTGSGFAAMMSFKKNGESSAERSDLIIETAIERMTMTAKSNGTNKYFEWGKEWEPIARQEYINRTGNEVDNVGFIQHETLMVGVSPDGLIDWDGGIEIKCPMSSKDHVEALINGVPKHYIAQIQGNMWISERDWWDYVSFDPRFPEHISMKIIKVQRDNQYIDKLSRMSGIFLKEVEDLYSRIALSSVKRG